MRIAAQRATISTPATTATEASTNAAGASFFEILAGASARPSNGPVVPVVNAAPQKDSDATGQNEQPQNRSDADAQINIENNLLQSIVLPVVPKSTAVQTPTPQAPITSNNGTNRTAGRDQRAQAAQTTSTADAAALVTATPIQIVPVAALPVPSPGSCVQSSDNSSAPSVAAMDSQTEAASDNTMRTLPTAGSMPAPVAGSNQNQPAKTATQAVKFAVEIFDPSLNAAPQPNQPEDSAPQKMAATMSSSQPLAVAPATMPDSANRSSSEQAANATSQPAPQIAFPAAQPGQPKDSSSRNSSPVEAANIPATSAPQTAAPVVLPLTNMSLPDFTALPNADPTIQPAVNTTQNSKANNASQPRAASITNAMSTTINAVNGQTTSTVTPASASARTAPNNAQGSNAQNNTSSNGSGQHTQSQGVQNQPAPQAPANSASDAQQMQTVAVHNTQHDSFASHLGSDTTVDATRANERPVQAEVNETLPSAGINTANVIQKMNETEMRVGMHSAEFGDISIRTSVSQQQMVTQISVDHGDLGKAISAHIPTLEAKLGGELGIRAMVQVSESGMSFSGERNSSSPQREQHTFVQPVVIEGTTASAEIDPMLPRLAAVAGDQYRLDIRA